MKIGRPAYYHRFRCVAGACPDSCCSEWTVDIDEETAKYYACLPGELGDALRMHLRREDGGAILKNLPDGRCPMWREDGLCRIQAEMGEDALSRVCQKFPRLTHDYGYLMECGLELSCPAAAEWILFGDGSWLEEENEERGEEPEYDPALLQVLLKAREEIIARIQDTTLSVPQALLAALNYARQLQAAIDGEKPENIDIAEEADPEQILAFFRNLEILKPSWAERLAAPKTGVWEEAFRPLAVYFVRRHFLQAVSDGCAVDRVRFAVLSCLVIHFLGGNICETAQKYSKEIENDPDNLDAIFEGFYFENCLSDGHLAACLMG